MVHSGLICPAQKFDLTLTLYHFYRILHTLFLLFPRGYIRLRQRVLFKHY